MRTERSLGPLAALGAVVFTAVWITLGLLSDGYTMWDITVEGYSPIAQPISGLGLGSTAPVMNAAFVGCGLLIGLGAWSAIGRWPGAGTRPLRWARALVAACGVGMAACGVFDLESIMLHTLGFLVAVGAPAVGFVIAGRALRGLGHRRLSAALQWAGPAAGVGLVAFLATFDATDAGDNTGYAGLIQRVLVTLVVLAVAAIGLVRVVPLPAPEPVAREGVPRGR